MDPRQAALHEVYDLRHWFLQDRGKEDRGVYARSKIATMREAAIAEDYDAFVKAQRRYLQGGRHFKNFRTSTEYIDPVSRQLAREDEHAFIEWLSPLQREKLQVARDYARDLQSLMIKWWIDGYAEASGEIE